MEVLKMVNYLVDNAGTSAYLAAGFAIVSFVALFIFFAGVAVFGPINDFLSIFQMLFLIPVVLALYQLLRSTAPVLSLLTTIGAVLALASIAVLQIFLVLRIVTFDFTIRPILILGVMLGIWWLVVGVLIFISGTLPTGLGWISMIVGASFLIIAVGFWIDGPQHPMAALGFLVGAIASPVWAVWLGRLLS
jgi:hypothetical protein